MKYLPCITSLLLHLLFLLGCHLTFDSLVAQMVKKKSVCSAGDLALIPGLGRSPGEGNGNPLQYSSHENPVDGGAMNRCYSPRGRKESDTTGPLHFIY